MSRTLTSVLGNSQRLDGGAMFGNVPRSMWEEWVRPDDKNRIPLACRCLVVRDRGRTILFETGIGAFFSPRLNDKQVENLEYARLPGMQIDRTRYDLLVGFSMAIYFQNGVFFSPRVTLAPPVFSAAAGSTMSWWWDLSLSLGWSI